MARPKTSKRAKAKKAQNKIWQKSKHAERRNQKNSPLTCLPVELLCHIATFTGRYDLYSLQLTCRAVASATSSLYWDSHFSTLTCVINEPSLKTLDKIVRNKKLNKYVREIEFVPLQSQYWHACGLDDAKPVDEKAQVNFIESPAAKYILIRAFQSLPCLKTLSLVESDSNETWNWNYCDYPDFRPDHKQMRRSGGSRVRTVDPPGYWGLYNHAPCPGTRYLAAFKLFALALAESPTHQLTTLCLQLCFNELSGSGLDTSPDPNFFNDILGHLETISKGIPDFSLVFPQRERWISQQYVFGGFEILAEIPGWENLAALLEGPTGLYLNFGESWKSGEICHSLFQHASLSNITNLELENILISSVQLMDIISKTPFVSDLRLYGIDLVEGTWKSVLEMVQSLKNISHFHLMKVKSCSLRDWITSKCAESEHRYIHAIPGSSDEDTARRDYLEVTNAMSEYARFEDPIDDGSRICLRNDDIAKYLPIFIEHGSTINW